MNRFEPVVVPLSMAERSRLLSPGPKIHQCPSPCSSGGVDPSRPTEDIIIDSGWEPRSDIFDELTYVTP